MMILAAVIATVLNIVIILVKINHKLWANASLDIGLLILVFTVLKGSRDMLLIGIFASLALSIIIWVFSPFTSRN